MNQTILLALLSRCRQAILERGSEDQQSNATATTSASAQPNASTLAERPYDNAYFYILFVMFFYSFLSLALFRSFVNKDKMKKEPYEEIMGSDPPAPKFNPGSSVEKFYFEEENSL